MEARSGEHRATGCGPARAGRGRRPPVLAPSREAAAAALVAVLCVALVTGLCATRAVALADPSGVARAPRTVRPPLPARAATPGTVLWHADFSGSFTAGQEMTSVVADAEGDAFFCGSIGTAGGTTDLIVAAFKPDGTALWTFRWGGPAHGDDGRWTSAALDGRTGRLYVAFLTDAASGHVGLGVLCLTTEGKRRWVHTWAAPSGLDVDYPSLTLDVKGSPCVGTSTYLKDAAGTEYREGYVCKYSAAGKLVWRRRWAPEGLGWTVNGVAAGLGGRVCATGTTQGSGKPEDIGTVTYSPAGKLLWAQTWDGPGLGNADGDYGEAVCFIPGGSVTVAGQTAASPPSVGSDTVMLGYDPSGHLAWAHARDEASHKTNIVFTMVADSAGDVFAGGWGVGPSGGQDGYLQSYGPTGAFRWSGWWGGSSPAASAETVSSLALAGESLCFGGYRLDGDTETCDVGAVGTSNGKLAWTASYGAGSGYAKTWADQIALAPSVGLYAAGGARAGAADTHYDGLGVCFQP